MLKLRSRALYPRKQNIQNLFCMVIVLVIEVNENTLFAYLVVYDVVHTIACYFSEPIIKDDSKRIWNCKP